MVVLSYILLILSLTNVFIQFFLVIPPKVPALGLDLNFSLVKRGRSLLEAKFSNVNATT